MNGKIVIVLAEGFEEIEAVTPIDVLRRLGVVLTIAGLDSLQVTGSHGIGLRADCLLADIPASEIGMLVLPGGMPGSKYLRDSDLVIGLLRKVYAAGGYVAAICAAPIALERAGLIDGKKVTSYPGVREQLGRSIYTGNMAEVDGRIITGMGPGASFEFTRRLAEALGKGREAAETFEAMLVK